MCDHRRLDDPNGARCTRDDCDGRGHIYKASTGSELGEGGHRRPEPNGDDQ